MGKKKFIIMMFLLIWTISLQGNMRGIVFDQPANFKGMTISDALAIITEDTGVNFVVEETFKGKIIDNSFVGGETLEEVVNIMATTNGMRVREIGNNIFILEGKATAGNTGASSIVGTVRTSNFGVGIDGAKITILNSGVQPVVTTFGGKFIINNVLPGTYIMKVERPGYETEGDFITVGKDDKNMNIDLHRSGEKIEVARSEASRSRVLGSVQNAGGKNTITEQINLLNVSADEAKTVLMDLMQDQVGAAPGATAAVTTSPDGATTSVPSLRSLESFRAIPVPKQNMLIVSGTSEQVKVAKSLLQILDKQSKQVRIAAQVIEITDNLFENLGFSWAYSSGSLKPTDLTNPNYPNSDKIPIGPGTNNGNAGNNSIGQQLGSGVVYPLGLDFFRFFNGKNDFLNFSINMLQATQDAVVSAIPSILVVNGETGMFKVTDESIVSYDSEVTENGFQSFTANLGEAGVILNVTPVIRDDDSIQLKIKVEVSKFLAEATAAKPTEGFANPKSQRIIETIVNVKNGDTIFIGGMKSASVNNGRSKVPFLGDIPIMGELFKSTDVGNKINDLYVKLKIDIANHDMVQEEADLKGFMMEEIHRSNNTRGGANIQRSLYPQFQ